MTRCYVLMAHEEDFDAARAACQAFGGTSDVVSYSTGAPRCGACSHSLTHSALLTLCVC
jgi:hypothetical protein